jgi:hypothetical protein
MSESERRPKEPRREKPVLKLPPIKKGIANEILTESVTDRHGFMVNTAGRMQRTNPHLLKFIVDTADCTDLYLATEDVKTWAFGYYEVYARSARKEGSPMVHVEEGIIEAREDENSRRVALLEVGIESDIFKLMIAEEEQEEQRIDAESEENEELAQFWHKLDVFRDNFSDDESEYLKDVVAEVSRFMHRQVDANVLNNQFLQE